MSLFDPCIECQHFEDGPEACIGCAHRDKAEVIRSMITARSRGGQEGGES
jgi:hypothetical protein